MATSDCDSPTIALAFLALMGTLFYGCERAVDSTWPKYPICFVEMGRGTPADRSRYVKTTELIRADKVLLIPYYSSYDRKTRTYTRTVARPILYRPQDPLTVQEYLPGYTLKGVVAVCPGYFGTGVHRSFYGTQDIEGIRCQQQRLMKAENANEAERILVDFKDLLKQKEITLGTTRDPFTVGTKERGTYALSTDFMTRSDGEHVLKGGRVACFGVWNYEHGTKLSVDITASEVRVIDAFFAAAIRRLRKVGVESRGGDE